MNNVTQLIIRACKVEDSLTRLNSVYRRFYFGGDCTPEQKEVALCSILSPIVDKYFPMTISEYLRECTSHESYYMFSNEKPRKYQLTLAVLVSKIAFTKTEDIRGYKKPLRWRLRNV